MENLQHEDSLYGEDYWCDSSSGVKAFNFDEDNDTIDSNSIRIFNWDDECTPERNIDFTVNKVISDDVLKTLLQEQCLTDECTIPKGVSADEELKLLRRQIQTTLYSPSPNITALKLLKGKIPSFEIFKSLEEKERLLDAIFQCGGGDAIISVLLFLKRTLSRELFFNILKRRPIALQQYISFLKSCNNSKEEALKILKHFGRHQEALNIEFSETLIIDDIEIQKNKFKELLETYNSSAFNINSVYIQKIHTSLKLIELIEKERNALDNMVDFQSTPIEVLYACCRKYSNWSEPNLTHNISPFRLSAEQHISPSQFEWTALNERTISQAYADLENIFERVPTWHPIKQKQFHISIPLDSIILRLYALNAPSAVLYLFFSKMSNTNEKVELARKCKVTKAEIDALAGLKDFIALNHLKEKLTDRSEEKFYCEKALKQLQNKRWSADNIKIKL